jgi:hypothetical protein
MRDLQEMAGEGSPLARKHKVHVHHAGVATLPENYEERMKELLPGQFKRTAGQIANTQLTQTAS